MVVKPEAKRVIKFKTCVSWGLAPLPETTFKLISNGAEDKVQIVHTVGPSKKSTTISIPNGTYGRWIEKLETIGDEQRYLALMPVIDGLRMTFGS